MRILFLSRWYPYPPDNGSKIRIYNLIKQLAPDNEIDLVSFYHGNISQDQILAMKELCNKVYTFEYAPFNPKGSKAVLGFFDRLPRSVAGTYNAEIATMVEQLEAFKNYDLVIASQIDMAQYGIKSKAAVKVLEEIELTTIADVVRNQQNLLYKFRYRLTWWKMAEYVRELAKCYDAYTVVSEKEMDLLRSVKPGEVPVWVVPNGVDLEHYQVAENEPDPDLLIFSGALTYIHNYNAVYYFLNEIFPIIREKRPSARLMITGSIHGVDLEKMPRSDHVEFSGYLNDIRPAIQRSSACIVPIIGGGGTRLKILEALALGTPVITTSKGAEGLDLRPGIDILLADTPVEFARCVLSVLENNELKDSLRISGRNRVEQFYDWRAIGTHFKKNMRDLSDKKGLRDEKDNIQAV